MSMLQEFLAAAIGVSVGYYYQVSNNYHLYTSIVELNSIEAREVMAHHSLKNDRYSLDDIRPYKMVSTKDVEWMADLAVFMTEPAKDMEYFDPFFTEVARPMFMSWMARKQGIDDGMIYAKQIAAEDWRVACTEWIERRTQWKNESISLSK